MLNQIVSLVFPVIMENRGYSSDKLEYSSPCPYCNGGKDRFRIWPNQGQFGRFWCRKCQVKGDGLKFVKDFIVNTQHQLVLDFIHSPQRPVNFPVAHSNTIYTKNVEAWTTRANFINSFYFSNMLKKCSSIKELIDRKINLNTVRQFKLGYVPSTIYEPAYKWGYFDNEDIHKKVAIHAGILMPRFVDGVIVGIKIRMIEPIEGQRYRLVRGSYSGPIMQWKQSNRVLCIVESDLDGMLLVQECSDLVDVCSLGSAAEKLKPTLGIDINLYDKIILCLDNDHAGYEAFYRNWKHVHRNILLWFPEVGKDIGDASKHGCDIRQWMQAGIKYNTIL